MATYFQGGSFAQSADTFGPGTDAFSFSAWMKFDDFGVFQANKTQIFQGESGDEQWALAFAWMGIPQKAYLQFQRWNTVGYSRPATSYVEIVADTWYFVAGGSCAAGSGGDTWISVNNETPSTASQAGVTLRAVDDVLFHNNIYGTAAGYSHYLAEFAMYGFELSAAQRAFLYGVGRVSRAPLMVCGPIGGAASLLCYHPHDDLPEGEAAVHATLTFMDRTGQRGSYASYLLHLYAMQSGNGTTPLGAGAFPPLGAFPLAHLAPSGIPPQFCDYYYRRMRSA